MSISKFYNFVKIVINLVLLAFLVIGGGVLEILRLFF